MSVGRLTQNIVKFSAITFLYTSLVHLGYSLPPEHQAQPVIYFGGAFGLLILLVWSKRLWPLLAIGWLIAFNLRDQSLPLVSQLSLGFGIALTCFACAHFLDKMKFNRAIIEVRDVVLLIVGTGIMAVLVAFVGMLARGQTGLLILPWTMSNLAGVVLVVPVVLAWLYGGKFGDRGRWIHFSLCIAATMAMCVLAGIFSDFFKPFHFFPVMIWAAIAFNVRGMAVINSIIGFVTYFATMLFNGSDRAIAIDYAQQSIVISGFTLLILSAMADHRRANQRLADREQRLNAIVETAQDGILVANNDGIIESMNPVAEKMFGFKSGGADGTVAANLLFPLREKAGREALHAAISANEPILARRVDGTEFPAQVTLATWTNLAGERFFTKIVRDLTMTERAAAELLDREERYRAIVETAVDGICVIDSNSIIQSFNASADRMFGFDSGEAIGQHVSILMHDADAYKHTLTLKHHIKTGESVIIGTSGVTVNARHKDGSSFPAHLAVAEWFVGGERFYTGIMRDLTKQVQSEEARDLLAREVDHRAKNALAVVQSLVRLTKAPTVKSFIEAVSGRIEALSRAHSLLSRGHWSGADLNQMVNDELAVAAKGGHVEISGSAVSIEADYVQPVSMVFHELATNAFKYGALSSTKGSVEVSWTIQDGDLLILWSETGGPPCIEPDTTGFGGRLLSQVIGKQLNGLLVYDWRKEGLCCTIRLPREIFKRSHAAKRAKVAEESAAVPQPGAGRRVLIVEDNELISMEVGVVLEDHGYTVVGRANTLEAGLKLAMERDFDVAVLDIDLGGEHSFPLADLLNQMGVPFTFASGFQTLAVDRGYTNPVLTKPVNEKALLLMLDHLTLRQPA